MAGNAARPANRRAKTANRNVKITNKEVKIVNKSVAMKRPGNILNSAPDANPRTNTQIKALVFWWSGVTLFYLWGGLKIDAASDFLGIKFESFPEQTFLFGLLALNVVFWVRLIWRIYISIEYNKHYDDAVEKSCQAKNPKIGSVEEYYEKNMRNFNKFEKWLVGLGAPLVLGFVAIVCLSHRLIFVCLQWPKTFFGFEVSTFIFWIIALVLVCGALAFAIVILVCEYCRQCKKNISEQGENNACRTE